MFHLHSTGCKTKYLAIKFGLSLVPAKKDCKFDSPVLGVLVGVVGVVGVIATVILLYFLARS